MKFPRLLACLLMSCPHSWLSVSAASPVVQSPRFAPGPQLSPGVDAAAKFMALLMFPLAFIGLCACLTFLVRAVRGILLTRAWEQRCGLGIERTQRFPAPFGAAVPEPNAYAARPFAMTRRERVFYEALRAAVRGAFLIGVKMRLADIVEVTGAGVGDASRPEFRRIAMKHVDFVLIEPRHSRIVLVVELDDETHRQQDRMERDEFLDRVLLSVGVPVLHQQVNDQGYNRWSLFRSILALCEAGGVQTRRSTMSGGLTASRWPGRMGPSTSPMRP